MVVKRVGNRGHAEWQESQRPESLHPPTAPWPALASALGVWSFPGCSGADPFWVHGSYLIWDSIVYYTT